MTQPQTLEDQLNVVAKALADERHRFKGDWPGPKILYLKLELEYVKVGKLAITCYVPLLRLEETDQQDFAETHTLVGTFLNEAWEQFVLPNKYLETRNG